MQEKVEKGKEEGEKEKRKGKRRRKRKRRRGSLSKSTHHILYVFVEAQFFSLE